MSKWSVRYVGLYFSEIVEAKTFLEAVDVAKDLAERRKLEIVSVEYLAY
jgi:hypothetical protein